MMTKAQRTEVVRFVLESISKSNGKITKAGVMRVIRSLDYYSKFKRECMSLIRFLVAEGFILIVDGIKGYLSLSEEGNSLLKSLRKPNANILLDEESLRRERFDFRLYINLLEYKKNFAKEAGIKTKDLPDNFVLEMLAYYQPVSVAGLYSYEFVSNDVPYGFWEGVVMEINNYQRRAIRKYLSNREKKVLSMIGSGKSISDIANELGVSRVYIARIIEKLILSGAISVDRIKDYNKYINAYRKTYNYFKAVNDRRLTIARKILNYSYDLLRVARAWYDVESKAV